jgi:hypothetical protein
MPCEHDFVLLWAWNVLAVIPANDPVCIGWRETSIYASCWKVSFVLYFSFSLSRGTAM